MKTALKPSGLAAIVFVSVLSFVLDGCVTPKKEVTRSWKTEAATLGIPEHELYRIASEAAKRHGGTAFSINRVGDDPNVIIILLGDEKYPHSGPSAVFKKTDGIWREDPSATSTWIE